MTFSVVIAAYNTANTIGATIGSVLAQTRQDFELLIVDDGSSDNTAAVAAKFASDSRVRILTQTNAGPSAARNRAIAVAKGKYISMLDSDDLWLPNYLAEMGRAFDENPEAGIAYASAWRLDDITGRFFRETIAVRRGHPPGPTLPHEQFIAALLKSNFISGAVTVRRSVLEQVGGFDPMITHGEDYELWLRIVISGFMPVRIPGELAIIRIRPGSASFENTAMIAGQRTVYRTVLERHPASAHVRSLTETQLKEFERLTDRRHRWNRAKLDARRAIAIATRRARAPWRLLYTPPPAVAEAFPGLGEGNRASRMCAPSESGQ